jgi:hypothetical protein
VNSCERSTALKREVLGSIVRERLLDACILAMLFALLSLSDGAGAPGGRWPAAVALAAVALVAGGLIYLRQALAKSV